MYRSVFYFTTVCCLIATFALATPSRAREYIRPDAPTVKIKPFTGERYEALVPDTLDLAERARLSVHGLTSPLDPNDDYDLYWTVNFKNTPPMMAKLPAYHQLSLTSKFMEALPLMRLITGSELNSNVDPIWMNKILRMVGSDGLYYIRREGNEPFRALSSCAISRCSLAVLNYYALDHNPIWKEIIEGMINRYTELAIDKGDYAYLNERYYLLGQKPDPTKLMPKGVWAVDEYSSRMIHPFGRYYAMTGYEPAKRLGDKIVHYIIYHSEYFGPDGEWLKDQLDPKKYPGREDDLHFGTHSHVLQYLVTYARDTGNRQLLEYSKKSYEWSKQRNSTNGGMSETATRIGFFQEYSNPYYPTAETCSVADMIAVAVVLAQSGYDECWDDIDRWVRNHFIENQITAADWIERLKSPIWPRQPGANESADRVAERNVGNFLSYAVANDGCSPHAAAIMHCCTGNGARVLFYVWNNILNYKDDRIRINLLLNRASKWVDVDSYIPYEGRVDVKVKTDLEDVSVRVPEWIAGGSKEVKCTVDGQARDPGWRGRYVSAGKARSGEVITLTFPIAETTIKRTIYGAPHATVLGGVEYERIVLRGNTVVHIEPEGVYYPFYQRDVYRTGKTRFIKVDRYVSGVNIHY